MPSQIPNLTAEQRQEALKKAAAVRHDRAERLDCVRKGEMTIAEFISLDDLVTNRTKVSSLLRAIKGFGPVSVEKFMKENGISEKRRVGGLGRRQREALEALDA